MSKPLILIPGTIYPHVIKRIAQSFEMIQIDAADDLQLSMDQKQNIVGIASSIKLPNDFIASLPSLEIIVHFGVGYDGIDANFAARNNIMVCNTPDVLSDEVADTTIALLINTLRELPKAEAYLRQGKWKSHGNYPLTKLTLRNRIIGIYGLGRIGQKIAKRLENFGVDIHYHSRSPKAGFAYQYHPSLLAMAHTIDTLIAIVPGGAETNNAIDKKILKALGKNGVLINMSRGSVVDEEALIKALTHNVIAAAGLDVFMNEPDVSKKLLALDNVSLLPHVASGSVHTRNAMADLQVNNLVNWFAGNNPVSPVIETSHIKRK